MNKEQQIEHIIVKFFSKSFTNDERDILFQWLKEDDQNVRYFLTLQNMWQISHPAFNPSDIDIDKACANVLQNINDSKTRSINKSKKLIVWWQKIAAILLIPVIAFTLYQNIIVQNESNYTSYQEVSSPIGLKTQLLLPDSSRVWLNSGSKLKFPTKFNSKKREVYLVGEAYFEVESDKKHPFIVTTQNMSVIATGTAFNVEAFSDDSITAVILLEGKVELNIGQKYTKQLKPNQRFVYNVLQNKYSLKSMDAVYYCQWKDGILAFRDEPLEEIFKRIGRIYNVEIKIKDKRVAKQLYRATFEGETLDEILDLLRQSAPINYHRIKRIQQKDHKFNKEIIDVYGSK
jgi:ferric-dicitrate binding protein FerR (iron transport regulator)